MSYEIAKELRDNGFPQTIVDKAYPDEEDRRRAIRINGTGIHDNVFYPLLHELVRAFKGKGQLMLIIGEDESTAKLNFLYGFEEETAETIELALSKLYIKLNRDK